MARVLFFSLPLHGHTNPSLPLVRELAGRGETLVYYSTDEFRQNVETAGAGFRPYRCAFLGDMTLLPERMDQVSWLLMRAAADVLEQELDACRLAAPAYVIADSVAPWGQWVGQALGVPVVTSITTFAINRHVLAYGAAHGVRPRSARIFFSKLRHVARAVRLMRTLRRTYRVPGPGLMGTLAGHSGLNIVYTSRYFQPCAERFDDRYRFVGPSLAARQEPASFPWEAIRHPRIVYVSLGTIFNTEAGFYRRALEALAGEDAHVILSIGQQVSPESLGPVPPNATVRAHVPQLEVLRRAAAFVTHGGMNSVGESLSFGVPVVVVPQMSEQEIVGRRVEELGAGVYLAKTDATAENIRAAVGRVLAEDAFRRQARAVGDSFAAAGGVAEAADAILAYTRSRG